jgi:hypothetical protein
MKRLSYSVCALVLAIALPAGGFAQTRGTRPPPPPQPSRPAPAPRPAQPARPAPPMPRPPEPQAPRPAPPNPQGFNFNRDINARRAPAQPPQQRQIPEQRQVPQQRPVTVQQPARANMPRPGFARAPNTNTSGGPFRDRFHGPVVRNPRAPGGRFGWNRGIAWNPAPIYWGGGFWGAYPFASLTDSLLYGSFVDDQNQLIYPSYQVAADSPGEELLQDYGLQQTQCGPPNLVDVWGPDNSIICALPNDAVGPGNYEVDPSTFTLVPASN